METEKRVTGFLLCVAAVVNALCESALNKTPLTLVSFLYLCPCCVCLMKYICRVPDRPHKNSAASPSLLLNGIQPLVLENCVSDVLGA